MISRTHTGSIFVVHGTVKHVVAPIGTGLKQSHIAVAAHPAETFQRWFKLTQVSRPVQGALGHRNDLSEIVVGLMQTLGVSNRQLAALIGTSHPTVGAILRGHEPARSPEVVKNLLQINDVVQRLLFLADHDTKLLGLALRAPDNNGESALDHLRSHLFSRAYLVAMDYLNRAVDTPRLTKSRLRTPSRETIALAEDDVG